uniref:Site-specific DNA-methyltransferase (adenine-specific) n=1 Tax=Prevotella sp. GTC17253 TaxID=3236793 RepID=A0AB33IWR6_9BACT
MKNQILRSPLFYVGDKYKLMEEISTHFPTDIGKFVEPFVGGGSVFMNTSAEQYLLNDIDGYIIDLHKYLCKAANKQTSFFAHIEDIIKEYSLSYSYKEDNIPAELKREYKKTYFAKYNKVAYEQMRIDFNESSKDDMAVLYLLLIYGFNRMLRFNKSGDFNLPVGNVDFNSNVASALEDYFQEVKNKKPKWYNLDYKVFLKKLQLSENDFIYLDPPYLITFSEYNKLWNENDEMELLQLLDKLNDRNIRFAISNVTHYKDRQNDIFIEWAQKYHIHSIKSNYINYHDNSIKQFNEVLITNY